MMFSAPDTGTLRDAPARSGRVAASRDVLAAEWITPPRKRGPARRANRLRKVIGL